jgi:hypothetical protein
MDRKLARGIGAAALALACACGGSDSGPQQQSMVPKKRASADAGDNQAPVVTRVRLEPSVPRPGQGVEAVVEASDPDGDPLRYSYRWTVDGRPLSVSGPTLAAGSFDRDARIEVSVVASDGLLDSEEMRVRTAVEPGAPSIFAISFDPLEGAKPGDTVTALVDAAAADDASLRLEYRWLVNGEATRASGRSFVADELRRGDRLQVEVTAFDGEAASDPFVSQEIVLANSPPEIAGIPKAERDGDAFRYQFEARDPDGDRSLRWSLSEAPAGMTIDPIYGLATWRPTKEQAGDQFIEVVVTDKSGDGSKLRFQVKVTATETIPGAEGQPPAPAAQAPAAPAPAS